MTLASEQQWLITVVVDGIGDIGIFDAKSGGDATSTPSKHRPGGMGNEQIVSALPVFSTLTLRRGYDRERDHALIASLRNLSGRANATVTEQPLDEDKNPFGQPRVMTGLLASVRPGNVDSDSNAVRMWEIDVEPTDSSN